MGIKWRGVPKKPKIANKHITSVDTGDSFSKSIMSEDGVDITAMNNRNNEQVRDLFKKANMSSSNMDLSQIFNDEPAGMSKTANTGGDTVSASTSDFYSPWLSNDYLELPRSYAEERRWYRFFYDQDPLVGRAIDLKTFIPLSKITLGIPNSKDHKRAQEILAFYTRMWKNLKMNEKLMWILHEYNLIGEVIPYFEWDDEEDVVTKVLLLDPDVCDVQYNPYTDETNVTLIPDNSIRDAVSDLRDADESSGLASALEELADETSAENGENSFHLNTDPREGSYVRVFSRKRSPYLPGPGVSILRRLTRTMLFRDKLRQALTQITSRHMTPLRLVWAEDLNEDQLEDLRMQVDLAITGPDHSIITSYEVHWEEITAEGRLFDATTIHDQSTDDMLIGLGMTKELLTGEGTYGGGRITLQVLDTEYALVRDLLIDMVDEMFRVVAEKKGFIEEDEESGVEYLVYPQLKFSRMSLQDYADMMDFMSALFDKDLIDGDALLELVNIDPVDVAAKKKEKVFTMNDSLFPELKRAVYGELVSKIVDGTDLDQRIIESMGMVFKTAEPEGAVDGEEEHPEDDFGGEPSEGDMGGETTDSGEEPSDEDLFGDLEDEGGEEEPAEEPSEETEAEDHPAPKETHPKPKETHPGK